MSPGHAAFTRKETASVRTPTLCEEEGTERMQETGRGSHVAMLDQGALLRVSDAVVVLDGDGMVTLVSPAVEEVFGWPPADLLGTGAMHHVAAQDRSAVRHALRRVLEAPDSCTQVTYRVRRADDDERWVETTIVNRLDDPEVRGVVATNRDVTDRHRAEDQLRASERRFRKLVQHSSDITLVIDREFRMTWVSPAVERVLGHDPDSLVGLDAAALLHPEDLERAKERMVTVLAGGRVRGSLNARVAHADGTWRHVGVVATDLTDDPDVGGLLLNVRDITGRVEAQQESDRLGRIIEATSDLAIIAEAGRGLTYLNAAGRQFFGLAPDADPSSLQLTERVPAWVRHLWDVEVLPALRVGGRWSGEMAAFDQTGSTVPLSAVFNSHRGPDGSITGVSAIARDMSAQKDFEAQLEHQATHDPLTGLPNRTLLLDRLTMAIGRSARSGRSVGVLFLDLDHFKVVNDSLGHGYGDQLLVRVAERISACLRPGDTVARFGGDEFVVLCEDLVEPTEASTIAERVAVAVSTPAALHDTEVFITASIGIAVADSAGAEPEHLLRDADAAMYQAKDKGRSRTEVFDARLRTRAVDRLELENALRRAVDRREMTVHYQPKADLDSGAIVGFEALLRWAHPERGLLMPADFLGIAEETRLIIPIGNWVTRQACQLLARAQALTGQADLAVCINLSARQLSHPRLAEDVAEILTDTGVDRGTVVLEITESVLMDDVELSQATLERLKDLGLLVAVDDFGTGYSSLAYLRRFPVDLLKVDRTFVDGLGTDPSDSAIVAAVITLAHTLGQRAIAEGVETAEQLTELRRLGCDMAQGYLLSHPLPEAELLDLLATSPRF